MSVCLSGWLVSAGLHKDYVAHVHKSWLEDEFQPRKAPLTFGADPDKGTSSLTLQDKAYFDISDNLAHSGGWHL